MNYDKDKVSIDKIEDVDAQNKLTVQEFVADQSNQQHAVEFAITVRRILGRGWFKLEELMPHIEDGATISELKNKIEITSLFGLFKKKSYKGGKKVMYKVHLAALERARLRAKEQTVETEEAQS